MTSPAEFRASTNAIGDFGETLARAQLSRPVRGRYRRPLFRASALGDKYPTADLIVDVLDSDEVSLGYFFVQIKSTRIVPPRARRLSVEVDLVKYNRLVKLPAPTFLVGVDIVNEKAFLICAGRQRRRQMYSITRRFDLDSEDVRIKLYKETIEFWRQIEHGRLKRISIFSNELA